MACARIGPWNSLGTGAPAFARRARTRSSSTTPIPPSSAHRTRHHRRRRHVQPPGRRAEAQEGQALARRRHGHPDEPRGGVRPRRARASTRSTTPSSPASGPTATTPRGAERGKQVAFVIELDGIHTIHLGDIGHLLTEEKLGGHRPRRRRLRADRRGAQSPTRAAALIAQLDPRIVVPMTVCEDEADCDEALKKFFHEMGAEPDRRSRSCRDDLEPADRDDHGPAGVARQESDRGAVSRDVGRLPGRGRRGRA